jgi:hypothetical protein
VELRVCVQCVGHTKGMHPGFEDRDFYRPQLLYSHACTQVTDLTVQGKTCTIARTIVSMHRSSGPDQTRAATRSSCSCITSLLLHSHTNLAYVLEDWSSRSPLLRALCAVHMARYARGPLSPRLPCKRLPTTILLGSCNQPPSPRYQTYYNPAKGWPLPVSGVGACLGR